MKNTFVITKSLWFRLWLKPFWAAELCPLYYLFNNSNDLFEFKYYYKRFVLKRWHFLTQLNKKRNLRVKKNE